MGDVCGMLGLEDAVFLRLMYKNQSVQRRAVHWRRLGRVRRRLKQDGAGSVVGVLGRLVAGKVLSGELKEEELMEMENNVAKILRERIEEVERDIKLLEDAAMSLEDLIRRGWFLSFTMSMFACLSRMLAGRNQLVILMAQFPQSSEIDVEDIPSQIPLPSQEEIVVPKVTSNQVRDIAQPNLKTGKKKKRKRKAEDDIDSIFADLM